MYIVQWEKVLCCAGEKQEKKDDLESQIANSISRSTKMAKAYMQELGFYLYVKLVEDSLPVLLFTRLCDALGWSCSWHPKENPKLTKGKKTITCWTGNFVPLVAVTKHEVTPLLILLYSLSFG